LTRGPHSRGHKTSVPRPRLACGLRVANTCWS